MNTRHTSGSRVRFLILLSLGALSFTVSARAASAKKKRSPAPQPAEPTATPAAEAPAPEMPARLPEALLCPVPADTAPGTDLKLRCGARASSQLQLVKLYYREPGSETFTSTTMSKGEKGWYEGTVPASVVTGSAVQVYFEAKGWGDKVLGTSGSADSPILIAIQGGEPAPAPVGPEATPLERQAAAAAARREREDRARELGLHMREPETLWLGAGAGLGGGWMPARSLDFRTDGQAAGIASQGGLHILPELGYQWNDRYAIALQFRYQFVSDEGGGDNTKPGDPPRSAWAFIAQAYRFFGESNLQGFASAGVGYGSAFRLYVRPSPPDYPRSDSVRGGPVAVGPGGGVLYHFNDYLAGVIGARALAGVPDFAVAVDVIASVQLALWTRGRGMFATDRSDPTLAE